MNKSTKIKNKKRPIHPTKTLNVHKTITLYPGHHSERFSSLYCYGTAENIKSLADLNRIIKEITNNTDPNNISISLLQKYHDDYSDEPEMYVSWYEEIPNKYYIKEIIEYKKKLKNTTQMNKYQSQRDAEDYISDGIWDELADLRKKLSDAVRHLEHIENLTYKGITYPENVTIEVHEYASYVLKQLKSK